MGLQQDETTNTTRINKNEELKKLSISYFDCGTREKIIELLSPTSEDVEEGLDDPLEFSDLSDPSRHMWIVTTAALPWRTGTAVNPFLRALYFVRRRLHLYSNKESRSEDSSDNNVQPGKVTLVIPWLVELKDAQKLCGGHVTETGEKGKEQQTEWIKKYAIEKCDMKHEIKHLDILFYDAAYWPAFGSIFPTVDICSLIPAKDADIAILEEPEHLNWMRVPDFDFHGAPKDAGEKDKVEEVIEVESLSEKSSTDSESETRVENKNDVNCNVLVKVEDDSKKEDAQTLSSDESLKNVNELGWAHKFKFVVGVIHTNYAAYMKQYGIGTTIVAAPAINVISSVVVRAYCHKVIRLSGVIPSYAKWKEVTCNVHGVRSDFLETPIRTEDVEEDISDENCAQVYFIGKLLWAKGFDRMLKVQESYRSAHPEKKYFPIDVFGAGPDELEIKRAFHGRLAPNTPSRNNADDEGSEASSHGSIVEKDETGVDVFTTPLSLRNELKRIAKTDNTVEVPEAYQNAKDYINAGFEIIVPEVGASDGGGASPANDVVMERRKLVEEKDMANKVSVYELAKPNPISILSDVSGRSISTGIATTKAVKNLADSAFKAGLAITFTQDEQGDCQDDAIQTQPSYRFDPPKTLFELRRTRIPARFLGVKDHALLRDVLRYKIFINTSVTEVLCTTTAEALAMGKFVIIPRHVSNEFFYQFSNCLAYDNLNDCVEKIQWALENKPVPLSEEEAHIFTWDAATDRMIEASIVTSREARERLRGGHDKGDSRMAWIHSQGGKKGSFIKNTFFGQTIGNGEEHENQNSPVSATP